MEVFQRSLADPDGFWGEAAQAIDWFTPPATVLDGSSPPFYRWFSSGVMITCHNAVDRHVQAGRGEQAAIIYDSPVTGTCVTISYNGGHAVALSWSMANIYDVGPGEVYWAASDIGWIRPCSMRSGRCCARAADRGSAELAQAGCSMRNCPGSGRRTARPRVPALGPGPGAGQYAS